MNGIAPILVRDNRKIDFTKKPKAFSFFNILSDIFRIGEELPMDLINLARFLS